MIQCRVRSCAVCVPWFAIVIVYANTKRSSFGDDWSARYCDCTRTAMPSVTALDVVSATTGCTRALCHIGRERVMIEGPFVEGCVAHALARLHLTRRLRADLQGSACTAAAAAPVPAPGRVPIRPAGRQRGSRTAAAATVRARVPGATTDGNAACTDCTERDGRARRDAVPRRR